MSWKSASIVLKTVFEPSSIAIIGASRDPAKLGHIIPKNILGGGFSGRMFLVNPNSDEILGMKPYASVEDIPGLVDLAVVVVPAPAVPHILEQCARKKVTAAIVMSGGFRELGKEGENLENKVTELARSSGIRLIGPNTIGVDNLYAGMSMWIPLRKKGPIGIITQSGSVGCAIESWAEKEGIGVSKCFDVGNRIDLNELDVLQYYETDVDTKVIVMYLEGVSDARKFMEIASRVSKTKPILVLKGGRTKAGQKAAMSHTRSMAGTDAVFDGACKQSGIIRANSLEELYDFAKAFSFLQLPKDHGVLIVTSSGGVAILAADLCEKLGLKLPPPAGPVIQELRGLLSPQCVLSNPFDLTTEGMRSEKFELVIERNLHDDNFHAFLAIFADPIPRAAEVIKQVSEKTEKPVVVCFVAGAEVEDVEKAKMHSMRIPVFPTPERAVVALSALVRRSEMLKE